ncbi:MAG: hypothetical protein WA724_09390 [Candidatus Dormiibacterota bacterium]
MPSMDSFRFSDHLGSEPEIALGLTAPRLGLAGLGAVLAWALTEAPGPAAIHLGAAALVVTTSATVAWGRVQGVSLARWSWLSVQYVARALDGGGEPGHPVDLGSRLSPTSRTEDLEAATVGVAFVSLRPGAGCSSVCRAVGVELGAAAERTGERPGRGSLPNLILYDWGPRQAEEWRPGRLIGLVLVWDGVEVYPGELAGKVASLRCTYPEAYLLAVLNRAGPAGDLSARIAEAGARLVCTVPFDRSLGRSAKSASEDPAAPSTEGVRSLALAVLAASKSW